MRRIDYNWRRWRTIALAPAIGVAIPFFIARAQTTPPLESRWWPSIGDTRDPRIVLFGNVVHCSLNRCDQATALGVDARLAGRLRVAADARSSGFDYGASYRWRRIGIAASVGEGTSLARGTVPRMVQTVRNYIGTAQRVISDTVFTPAGDSTTHDAVRWSSTDARLTWHEERWWITALVGRVTVARQGAGLWTGLQLGADVGRGASLLLGVRTASRPVALAGLQAGQHSVSLGLGFKTSFLSAHGDAPSEGAPSTARAAFEVSNAVAGRVRITIRLPSASSVAFASDCTGWTPVDMTPTRDGWVIDVAATHGPHRADIRVDGGGWIAPPGLGSTDDDFAGKVGIFVVE